MLKRKDKRCDDVSVVILCHIFISGVNQQRKGNGTSNDVSFGKGKMMTKFRHLSRGNGSNGGDIEELTHCDLCLDKSRKKNQLRQNQILYHHGEWT